MESPGRYESNVGPERCSKKGGVIGKGTVAKQLPRRGYPWFPIRWGSIRLYNDRPHFHESTHHQDPFVHDHQSALPSNNAR